MSVRVRVLVLGAMIVVAAATTLITLSVLSAPAVLETATRESTRTLEPIAPPDASSATAPSMTNIWAQEARPREPTPEKLREFDAGAAMVHIRALESFGVRAGGSAAETAAAGYLRDRLAGMGLDAHIEEFPLTNGAVSRNVIARIPGSSDAVLVLGAHYDSKPPSPGANDNASGSAALLEIAGILAERPAVSTVEVVFFGSEEIIGGDPSAHHFGSRYRVSQMSAAVRARAAGMISIDMIGYGSAFHSRTMRRGPIVLSDLLLAEARRQGIPMTYLRDSSSSGLSDHEAYALAGIPASCVTWRTDPVYHTAGDVSSHVSATKVATAGGLVLDFVRGLDQADLSTLLAR